MNDPCLLFPVLYFDLTFIHGKIEKKSGGGGGEGGEGEERGERGGEKNDWCSGGT